MSSRILISLVAALAGSALAGCSYDDSRANAASVAYVVASTGDIPPLKDQAQSYCDQYERSARLSNVSQFDRGTVAVFDCRPPKEPLRSVQMPADIAPAFGYPPADGSPPISWRPYPP